MRVVIDTGVSISGLIRPGGPPGAILRALRDGRFAVIYSTEILVEMIEVLGRAPFRQKYHLTLEDITALINLIRLRGELVSPREKVHTCRDPKDDKFLEAALAGQADCIVSGDLDLLDLDPFQGIPVYWPAEFLTRL
ncbi:MAG: putative toxin-antitoxin system toxin component, PIN family [Chloroflexota bacterium]